MTHEQMVTLLEFDSYQIVVPARLNESFLEGNGGKYKSFQTGWLLLNDKPTGHRVQILDYTEQLIVVRGSKVTFRVTPSTSFDSSVFNGAISCRPDESAEGTFIIEDRHHYVDSYSLGPFSLGELVWQVLDISRRQRVLRAFNREHAARVLVHS